ncbi:MAG: hypothetical protein AUJ71_02360 [Candidatus Omnitrophica bacterium CG1_02_49_16]|nr:MAG: hypothetical protein AUJ71_02360 [Candidatus Omnitrophica bacterium CG1_02_49_16]
MFCKISASLIARLVKAPVGGRISQVWTGMWVNGDTGRFPVKLRFRAPAIAPSPDQAYNLGVYWRKAEVNEEGRRYSIDHWELRFYPKTSEELVAAGVETVYVLDFAICGKREDIAFSRQPFKIWRVEGTTERGVLYGYDLANEPGISVSGINSEILRTLPVRVDAVGVEPIVGPKNSTSFLKYEVEGAECLYDRRHKRNGSGLLEVVRTTKGDRSWLYLNLKDRDASIEYLEDDALLTASNGKLAVVNQDHEPVVLGGEETGEYL